MKINARLVIERRASEYWYIMARDMEFGDRWQYGGETIAQAVESAKDRCFIQTGDVVQLLNTGETFKATDTR